MGATILTKGGSIAMENENRNQPNVALIIAVIVVAAVALYILLIMPGPNETPEVPVEPGSGPIESRPLEVVETRNWFTEDEQGTMDEAFRRIELEKFGEDASPEAFELIEEVEGKNR